MTLHAKGWLADASLALAFRGLFCGVHPYRAGVAQRWRPRAAAATLPAFVAAWSIFRRQWVNRRCSEFVIRSPL